MKEEGFYHFNDVIRNAIKHNLITKGISHSQFLGELAYESYDSYEKNIEIDFARRTLKTLLATQYWYEIGTPYCKIYSDMAYLLAETKIDIPFNKLIMPYSAFEIAFSQKNEIRENDSSPPLHGIFICSQFEADIDNKNRFMQNKPIGHNHLLILLDFGEKIKLRGSNITETLFTYLSIGPQKPTDTFTEVFEYAIEKSKEQDDPTDELGYIPSIEFRKKILAITIATCFFMSDQHELIAPDIPRRYIERYKKAQNKPGKNSQRELKEIEDQSKKIRHFGWNLGREINLPKAVVVKNYDSTESDSGKTHQLYYRHARSPHLRYQPYGPRQNPQYKLTFIHPVIVRPDLPPDPRRKGFKIQNLNQKA